MTDNPSNLGNYVTADTPEALTPTWAASGGETTCR